ncbi:MAG: hypothetical protein LBS84_04805 [Clostridiales bacterium]|nr:hypothetical protein [Clostridiales bacterium]
MNAQILEGYFENGKFYPFEQATQITGRRRALITILDEPAKDKAISKRLAALDEFFDAIGASDEEIPEFERVNINRELDL